MTRRTIAIIAGALLFVALLLAAWYWLFSKGASVNQSLFGGGAARNATSSLSAGENTNISQTVPTGVTAGSGGATNVPLGGGNGSGTAGGGTGVNPFGGSGTVSLTGGSVSVGTVGVPVVPGVDWLGGTGTGGSSGAPITSFTPSATNQLNDGTVGGQVTIFGTPPAISGSNSNNLLASLAVTGIGTALCTAGLFTTGAAGVGTAAGVSATALATANGLGALGVPTSDKGAYSLLATVGGFTNANLQSANYQHSLLDCIARTIGRAIVNQITASVVNWINGGFKGKPSFVQNFSQFFANVADQAAGAYIQGSALSFLCSPFQLQVKLAIAKSYANRNAAASCSLSSVTNNVNRFVQGNFNSGGWPAFLSMTSVPTNNPYGALAYGQVGLATAQQNAIQNANRSITPGGFISFAQTYNCQSGAAASNGQLVNNSSLFLSPTQAASGVAVPGCQTRITTPGSVIESSLTNTINGSSDMVRQLGISGSFDAILSALITQLMSKVLQSGLSNLSGTNGYAGNYLTPDQQQAQDQGNALLVQLQAAQQTATQYGQVNQGSISDIQNSQQQLENLSQCWETISTSEQYSDTQRAQATQSASSTQESIASLEAQVALYNGNITRANTAIALLQQMETQTLAVGSTADVAAITAQFNAAASNGGLITGDDVTQAQQDRTTLQSGLQAQNDQTAANLKQCQDTKPQ